MRRPVRESHFSGSTWQGGQCMYHGLGCQHLHSLQGGGVMFFILHKTGHIIYSNFVLQIKWLWGDVAPSVSALLLVLPCGVVWSWCLNGHLVDGARSCRCAHAHSSPSPRHQRRSALSLRTSTSAVDTKKHRKSLQSSPAWLKKFCGWVPWMYVFYKLISLHCEDRNCFFLLFLFLEILLGLKWWSFEQDWFEIRKHWMSWRGTWPLVRPIWAKCRWDRPGKKAGSEDTKYYLLCDSGFHQYFPFLCASFRAKSGKTGCERTNPGSFQMGSETLETDSATLPKVLEIVVLGLVALLLRSTILLAILALTSVFFFNHRTCIYSQWGRSTQVAAARSPRGTRCLCTRRWHRTARSLSASSSWSTADSSPRLLSLPGRN